MRNLNRLKKRARQVCASILGAAMAASLFLPPAPLSTEASAAVSYAKPYMDKLSEWDIMQGDETGNLRPEAPITRAEFTAMINRAYGYTEPGNMTFSDVQPDAWYADDISIAQRAGYFTGTSASTAEPDAYLTREQAMVLLAKSGRLETIPGEVTEFSDGRDFSTWGKGYVKAAVKRNLIAGYPDGTFRPKNFITRAEMSCLLCNALGTLINTGGERELGDVYGNVTINAPGTTLKDTTIAGDLYISGGLGLGAVTLDNVRVLGRIIIAGGGESEGGEDSVVMRNVESPELIIDNLANNYLSLRAEGETDVNQTFVRSSAFIRDRSQDGFGLKNIILDGTVPGLQYSLAGDLKNVVNKAPYSTLNIGDGSVETLTMDELAAGGTLNLDYNATVETLNLDTGVPITGTGDIETANINSNGTTTSMLPDKIIMRPGVTANVSGSTMNSTAAQEATSDPKLLAGYPSVNDIAPTNANATFSTNKPGTIYWAVSSITNGSVDESELISPLTYSSKAVQHGNLAAAASNTEYSTRVNGLTKGGSYYLSSVMVDSRGTHSPVKVVSFTTPDDTVPAFASGYPYMSKITNKDGQANVMATKSCDVYYALYDQGSTAPTPDDFRNGRVTDSLGHGVVALTKNLPDLFRVNDRDLDEEKTYDLYLWLNDADNSQSSAVQKISFTTVDKTPPEFVTDFTINKIQTNSIGAIATLNENGTLYWVVVAEGATYPTPPAGETEPPALDSDFAKLQVSSGMGALVSGQVAMRENTDAVINIGGLQPETSYDIYYIAKDTAGNYSKEVIKITGHTLDQNPPTVTREFTRFSGTETDRPYANTDIRVIFSENVAYVNTANNTTTPLIDLYNKIKNKPATVTPEYEKQLEAFEEALYATIKLYDDTKGGVPEEVKRRTKGSEDATDWIIDYRNARLELKEGKLTVLFPTTNDADKDSALNLSSGSTYHFEIENIEDMSHNRMGLTKPPELPAFTTIASQVAITDLNLFGQNIKVGKLNADGELDVDSNGNPVQDTDNNGDPLTTESDVGFSLTPLSTSTADPNIGWDLLILADKPIGFELYEAVRTDANASPLDRNIWKKVGDEQSVVVPSNENDFYGRSYKVHFKKQSTFDSLTDLKDDGPLYDYALHLTWLGSDSARTRGEWTQTVNFRVYVVSGNTASLNRLAQENLTNTSFKTAVQNNEVSNLSVPEELTALFAPFSDTIAPKFIDEQPTFEVHDTSVTMNLMMNRSGVIYYMIVPVSSDYIPAVTASYTDGSTTKEIRGKEEIITIPKSGNPKESDYTDEELTEIGGVDKVHKPPFWLTKPGYLDIVNPQTQNARIKTGTVNFSQGITTELVTDLSPRTDYLAYFVLRGSSEYTRSVQAYRFKTKELDRPVLYVQATDPNVTIQSSIDASVSYLVVPNITSSLGPLGQPFIEYVDESYLTPDKKQFKDEKYKRYESFTVVQAMAEYLTDTENNKIKGSVFDEFADVAKSTSLATTIQSAAGSSSSFAASIYNGTLDLGENVAQTIPYSRFDKMSTLQNYYIVAVGQATAEGLMSGYAFGAAYPIKKVDSEAPIITNVSGLFVDGDGKVYGDRVTVTFSEGLYQPLTDEQQAEINTEDVPIGERITRRPVNVANTTFDDQTGKKVVSLKHLAVYDTHTDFNGSYYDKTDSLVATSRAVFYLAPNTRHSITIQGPLGDSSGNNVQTGPTIEITSRVVSTDENGKPTAYEPVVKITPRVWDGREQ